MHKFFILRKSCFLICLVMASCQTFRPISTNDNRYKVPAQFTPGADSLNIALIPRRQFFTDTNLVRLIDTAVAYNFDLQRAIQRMQFAKAGVLLARGRYLPVVNAVGSAGVDKYGDYTMNGVGNYDSNLSPNLSPDQKIPNPTPDFFLGLRSSWEISLWGSARNMRKAAYARFLASDKARQAVMTAMIANVATAYYELLALDNELLTIQKNIRLQERAFETIQEMKMGGRANELAVKQFKAQMLDTKGLEVKVTQEIVRQENLLNLLLGRFPQTIKRGVPIRAQVFPSTVGAGIPSQLLLRRPDIQQAELEMAASKADVKVARAAFLPTLTLSASTGFNAFKAPLLFSSPASLAYGALAGLTAPLLNRTFIRSGYRRSVAYQMDAYYAYQQSVVSGFQEVVTSLHGIQNYEKVYQLKGEEVEDLLEAVDVSKELFSAGYASYLEVITAQKYVLDAEIELSEARKIQFQALIDLYRSLGGGWE